MDTTSTVIIVSHNGMGHAEPGLSHKLMVTYLKLLRETNRLPAAMGFITEGVKLLVEDSPVLEQLQELEKAGVLLIACGTCLNYYGIMDQLKVGIVGHMSDVIDMQHKADKLISL
jgi:selenium metabolism protein YedF